MLEELKRRGRKPEAIVIDNGGEFTSQVMDQWAYENQVSANRNTIKAMAQRGLISPGKGSDPLTIVRRPKKKID